MEPAPASAASPVLDMDWDDDDLSTQIYDRPEDGFEGVESGVEEAGAGALPSFEQRNIVTYVPPATGDPNALPGVQVAPQIAPSATPAGAPAPAAPLPPAATQTDVVRDVPTSQPQASGSNNSMLVVIGAAVLGLVLFGAYTMFGGKDPGEVYLTTSPADAQVLFDGRPVGGSASPFVITNVEPGVQHSIEVSKEGFNTWSTQVLVQPGKPLQVPPVTLTKASGSSAGAAVAAAGATGGFEVTTKPIGAKVTLDGEPLDGATPLRVSDLGVGEHVLELSLPEYKTHTERIAVTEGNVLNVPITLKPLRVNVRVDSEPRGATVTLRRGDETKTLGETPLTVPLDNNGDPWSVEVAKNGYKGDSRKLDLDQGSASAEVKFELEREGRRRVRRAAPDNSAAPKRPAAKRPAAPARGGKGTLRVNTRPWSQVYVDNRLIGNTPQMNIKLPAGKHRVTLVNPDFSLRRTVTVTIKAGETVTKVLNLN